MSLPHLETDITASVLSGWDDPETIQDMGEFEEDYQDGGTKPHQYDLSTYDVVQAFIRCAKMHTETDTGLLDRQQEIELANTIQQGLRAREELRQNAGHLSLKRAEHAGINAEELLVAGNALLVVSEARAYMRTRPVLDCNLEELVAQGLQGLAVAARNYTNPSRASFATFAKPTIIKFIRSADASVFGSATYFSRDDRESVWPSLLATNSRLTDELGKTPTMEELSDAFNTYHAKRRADTGKPVPTYLMMGPERAGAMMSVMNPRSMEAPIKADGAETATTLESLLPDTSELANTAETATTNVLTAEAHDLLMKALDTLGDEKMRRFLLLTFQFGVDPDENKVLKTNGEIAPGKIAKVLGIGATEVSRMRKKALAQLAKSPDLRHFWASFRQVA